MLAEAASGTLGSVGSYTPPRSVAQVEGRGRRADADLLVLGRRRRGVGGPRDRPRPRRQGLDRARRRPLAEPAAGDRPGRGLRLHGPGRGADGGAGLPQGPAQDPVDAGLQEPDHARDAARRVDPGRDARPRGPVRRQGVRAGSAPARHPGGGERHPRRARRAHRRGADHAREDPGRAGGPLPRAARCPRSTIPRPSSSSRSLPPRRPRSRRSAASAAAAAVPLPAADDRARGRAAAGRARRRGHGGRGRDGPLPEHEAPPVRAEGAGLAARRSRARAGSPRTARCGWAPWRR